MGVALGYIFSDECFQRFIVFDNAELVSKLLMELRAIYFFEGIIAAFL